MNPRVAVPEKLVMVRQVKGIFQSKDGRLWEMSRFGWVEVFQ